MSIETMALAIEAEAAGEAAAAVERARAEAQAIVRRAEAQESERLAEIRARAEPGARAEAVRGVNAARLRLLGRRASLLAERVSAAYAAAEAQLAEIAAGADAARWTVCLERLAVEGVRLAGADATIVAREADAAILRDLAARGRWPAGIVVGDRVGPGLVVRATGGGVEVDATIAARLATARVRLADAVAARLAIGPAR